MEKILIVCKLFLPMSKHSITSDIGKKCPKSIPSIPIEPEMEMLSPELSTAQPRLVEDQTVRDAFDVERVH